MRRLLSIFLLVIVGAFSSAASAADIRMLAIDSPAMAYLMGRKTIDIGIFGDIEEKSPAQLKKVLASLPKDARLQVHLNSNGGVMTSAIEMAYILRAAGANTSVGGWKNGKEIAGVCYSACVDILAGGVFRSAHPLSSIGVHQFSGGDNASASAQRLVAKEILLFKEMGVDETILALARSVPAEQLYEISLATAKKYRLLFNGIYDAIWTIEQSETNAYYLKGEQTRWSGTNKVLFFCGPDKQLIVGATSEVGVKRKNELLATPQEASIFVDDGTLPIRATFRSGTHPDWIIVSSYDALNHQQIEKLLSAKKNSGIAIQPTLESPIYIGGVIDINDLKKYQNFIRGCK